MTPTAVVRPEPYWLIAAALVIGDQLTKLVVRQVDQPIALPGISIKPVLNPQGVLGLSVNNNVLIVAGVCIIIGLLLLLAHGIERRPIRLGLWLIIGGAFSNVVDRLVYGGAVDVISILDLSRFNLADVMIVLGAVSVLRGLWSK